MVGGYEPALLALLVLLFDHWHIAFAAVPSAGLTCVKCLFNEWILWDGCWGLVMQCCDEETELWAERA